MQVLFVMTSPVRLDADVRFGATVGTQRTQQVSLAVLALTKDNCNGSFKVLRDFKLRVIDVLALDQIGHCTHQ
jgi:hypothetical protein